MKDVGLRRAIEAAGGVGSLARALGISQPSVSNWARIPAERVIAVEGLTGVGRSELRPDLYPGEPIVLPQPDIDDLDRARATQYLLLARLLRNAPDRPFLARLAAIKGDASEIGMALVDLAEAAEVAQPEAVAREFFALFIGVGRSEILPYGSYYLTGFLHERPLARVREDLAALGIERAAGDFEPEDHLGTLFEVMAGMADGTFDVPLERQKAFFERHIAPWAARFFADLGTSPSAAFYRAVARLGRAFVTIEAEGFAIGS